MSPQQQAELRAWHTHLAARFNSRRCCVRGCNKQPVFAVVIGEPAQRLPNGELIRRAIPDRGYCVRHAPGLRAEAVASP